MTRRRTLPTRNRAQTHARPSSRERGFSLPEVMVALAILAFGVLGATAGQVAAMKVSSNSKSHGLALSLAEQQMEAFQATTLADVVAEIGLGTYPNDPNNPIMVDPGGGTSLAFDRSWQIEQDTPEAGLLRITVTVVWEDANSQDRSARVQSLKAAW